MIDDKVKASVLCGLLFDSTTIMRVARHLNEWNVQDPEFPKLVAHNTDPDMDPYEVIVRVVFVMLLTEAMNKKTF